MISDTDSVFFFSRYCHASINILLLFILFIYYINSEEEQIFKIQNTVYNDPCELVSNYFIFFIISSSFYHQSSLSLNCYIWTHFLYYVSAEGQISLFLYLYPEHPVQGSVQEVTE